RLTPAEVHVSVEEEALDDRRPRAWSRGQLAQMEAWIEHVAIPSGEPRVEEPRERAGSVVARDGLAVEARRLTGRGEQHAVPEPPREREVLIGAAEVPETELGAERRVGARRIDLEAALDANAHARRLHDHDRQVELGVELARGKLAVGA